MINDAQLCLSLTNLLDFDKESPEGAVIFLNGSWGSGKTYFWKNSVQPSLKNTCLYVSLFGVHNVSSLKEKLIAAIISGEESGGVLSKGRKIASKFDLPSNVSSAIKKFTGVELRVDVLEIVGSRYVVCFDDLERLPESAAIEEILGFINYLSEHKGYRCLVIMNDAEIKEARKADYQRLREKLSLRTFQLSFDLEARFYAFINSRSAFQKVEISADEVEILRKAMVETKTDNLRTVRFILDCYLEVREQLKRELPDWAVKFLVSMVDHESRGNSETMAFYDFNPMEIHFREHRRKDGKKDSVGDEPSQQSKFYYRYFGENASYRFVKCLFDLVKQGCFDSKEASQELFPPLENLSEAEQFANNIKDTHFFFSDDEELKRLLEKIPQIISTSNELSFITLILLARGMSSAIRLLEMPEPTLPPNFEDLAVKAAKLVNEPSGNANEFEHRSNDLLPVFTEVLSRVCQNESARRKTEKLSKAIADGTTGNLKEYDLESPEVLEIVFSSGLADRIWSSSKLTKEERYRLFETLIKSMRRHYTHNEKVRSELIKIHAFLMKEYNETVEKMLRLRTYRLLEVCAMELPSDAPSIAKRNT